MYEIVHSGLDSGKTTKVAWSLKIDKLPWHQFLENSKLFLHHARFKFNMPIFSVFRHFYLILLWILFLFWSVTLCAALTCKRFSVRTRISLVAVSFLHCSFTDEPFLYLKGLSTSTPFIHVYMFVLSGSESLCFIMSMRVLPLTQGRTRSSFNSFFL